MTNVLIPLKRHIQESDAAVGVGSLIIFIAMILVAGITASVMIQTMESLQQQAVQTSQETLRDVASGIKVTHISGYTQNSQITQLAIFISTIAASEDIDLSYALCSLSDSSTKVVLNYTSSCFSNSVSGGLFGTLNASNLSANTFGLMVIRDVDGSCTAGSPTINDQDLVVLLINTTACFSGIGTRADVSGEVYPEFGIRGVIGFTTPSSLIDTIVDL